MNDIRSRYLSILTNTQLVDMLTLSTSRIAFNVIQFLNEEKFEIFLRENKDHRI